MARIVRHHHLNVDRQFRQSTRALYEGVLGGKLTSLRDTADTDVEVPTPNPKADLAESIGARYLSSNIPAAGRDEVPPIAGTVPSSRLRRRAQGSYHLTRPRS